MRRLLSILLLAILGLGPAISAVPAAALTSGLLSWSGKVDESRLPACCRHNGKHHCAMSGGTEHADSSTETTLSANDSCPFAPLAMAATAPSVAAVPTAANGAATLASELCVLLAAVALAVLADRRSQPKRGPPSFQIL
jgi:hypothetical protein